MNLRKKLTIVLGGISLLIVLLSLISTYYIWSLSKATKNILTDNSNSLEYVKDMLVISESLEFDLSAIPEFKRLLDLQMQNTTESSEKTVTNSLFSKVSELESGNIDLSKIKSIRSDLYRIADLNMAATYAKGRLAEKFGRNAILSTAFFYLSSSYCY